MKRHQRDNYFIVEEGIYQFDAEGRPACVHATDEAAIRKFRFSRSGPKGDFIDGGLRALLATEMIAAASQPDSAGPIVPAGYTYLGQFVDHDLTLDKTAASLGQAVTVDELMQGRSPALDLDSVYGRGPGKEPQFYEADGIRLKTGASQASPQPVSDAVTTRDLEAADLPRVGFGSTPAERMKANIPDLRNDENLVVAQTHLAFIRFHNRVVAKLAGGGLAGPALFEAARDLVVRHYQWMLRTDYLPRIVEPRIVDDVFTNGRKFFEPNPVSGVLPTMPIEFSVAAFRLGHSQIRDLYQWNRVFREGGVTPASLALLFQFSGTSGGMLPGFERLPTNWVADFARLYDFGKLGIPELKVPAGELNVAKNIDTHLVDPLKDLPPGSFGGAAGGPDIERNLAFRNLTRADMVQLASGQQMVAAMRAADPSIEPLSDDQIIVGKRGVNCSGFPDAKKKLLVKATPLWFYILREAELNGGRLTGVGGRLVAEVFHRAMEGSQASIVREPAWRPSLGKVAGRFEMPDLLFFTFGENPAELRLLA